MAARLHSIVLSLALFTGCLCAEDATVEGSIGPSGGTLATPDRAVRLIVPRGALDRTQRLAIRPLPPSRGPDDPEVLVAVELEPEGLAFRIPAPA